MKLRIHENSLRLRLASHDLEKLGLSGRLQSSIRFGPEEKDTLAYSLEVREETRGVAAELREGGIRFFIDNREADRLASGGEVSIRAEQSTGEGNTLIVLIERDFAP